MKSKLKFCEQWRRGSNLRIRRFHLRALAHSKFLLMALAAISFAGCSIEAVNDRPVNKEDIRKTILFYSKEIRLCYEKALEETPMLEGRIVMDWTIGSDGHPYNVNVRTASPKIRPVIPCLEESMKTWLFRSTNDSVVTVSYPFVFSENHQFERVRKETAPGNSDDTGPTLQQDAKDSKPASSTP